MCFNYFYHEWIIITVTSLYLLSISHFSWFRLNINRKEYLRWKTSSHLDINMLDNKKVTALFLLVAISIGRIDAFPNGAPSSACTTMSPVHGYPQFPPQVTPSPYQTEIPAGVNIRNCLTFPRIIQLDCSASNQTYSEWNLIGVRLDG